MATSFFVSLDPIESCLNGIQHRFYDMQKKVFNECNTENKVHAFLIIGRVLQAAALLSFPISIACTFLVGPIFLIASVPAVALGVLGTYVADHPQQLIHFLQTRPFGLEQPVGLINSGNNCWLNSSLQLLINAPSFHQRLHRIPEFSQFLDRYAAAQKQFQKAAATIDTHAIRQFLSRETAGQITADHVQEDPAQFFEYLFGNPNALYQFEQQLDGAAPVIRSEPMIQIDLGSHPRLKFQQLFNNYFNYHSEMGQHIQLFLQRPPDALLIQVKRFYQQMDPISGVLMLRKINDPLDAPEKLTLFDRFVRSRQGQDYICDGFTIHHGESQDNGHYTCYLKTGGAWWYLSDSTVHEVPECQALQAMTGGYIFHYSGKQQKPT